MMNCQNQMPDIGKYLARIGLSEPVSVDRLGLDRLIRAHLTHVPFEALDVWGSGGVPSLEIHDLYRKIVIDHRGGYCFELNSLFCAMLNEMGFETYLVIASLLDKAGEPEPPAHSAIVCCLDEEKYFVDVGFGGPVPFGAMLLAEGEEDGFRFEKKGGYYLLKKISGDGEKYLLRFRDVPVEPVELIPLNFYISQKPDIHFRHRLLVSQRKEDGSVYTLKGNMLHLCREEAVLDYPVNDLETLCHVLQRYFSIEERLSSITFLSPV